MLKQYAPVFIFEELEPRLLFSADGAEALVVEAEMPQESEEEVTINADLTPGVEEEAEAPEQLGPDVTDPEQIEMDVESSTEAEEQVDLSEQVDSEAIDQNQENDEIPVNMDVDEELILSSDDTGEEASTENQITEVVFIDSSISDAEPLIDDILQESNDDKNIDLIILDSNSDGIEQVTAALADYEELNTVHFITHGYVDRVNLGDTLLTSDSLVENSTSIAQWGDALADNGDILFYGCSVAAGESGQDLMTSIAELTDADVAASTDRTGHADTNGDWDLEFEVGTVESSVIVSEQLQEEWQESLTQLSFQQGVSSGGHIYTGTQDSFVSSENPDDNFNAWDNIQAYFDDPFGPNDFEYGLIKFDDIFGNESWQIPYGAEITNAYMILYITDTSDSDNGIRVHEISGTWSESAVTWSTGPAYGAEMAEASVIDEGIVDSDIIINGLESSLNSWSAGAQNEGWLFEDVVNSSFTDSYWAFASSEYGTVSLRPELVVEFNAPPAISNTTISVSESAMNGSILADINDISTGNDTDLDGDTLSYSITAGNTSGVFAIDSGSGLITVSDNSNLDYEISQQYTLTIETTDGSLTDIAQVTVDITQVNDNLPVFTSPTSTTLSENFSFVHKVIATDNDLPGDTLTYSIAGTGADDALFTIDAGGNLYFQASPDFENPADSNADNQYMVDVQVDDGVHAISQSIVVTITDSNEFGITTVGDNDSSTNSVAEDVTIGTTVGITAFADDADGTDFVSYSLVDDAGGRFTIDSVSGVITVASTDFDYESATSHTVWVEAQSSGGGISSRVFTINVTNINESPLIGGDDSANITEDVDPDTDTLLETSGVLTIVDPDTGESGFVAETVNGTYGNLNIDVAGAWSYSADNTQLGVQQLDDGQSVLDVFEVTTIDGTTHNISITINGAEDVPVLGGTTTGSVFEDGSLVAGNSLTITDVDSSDNPVSFIDVAATAGDNGYGTFTIIGNTWSYNLNNSHTAVQALDASENIIDTFTFTASDGSMQLVTISINGSEDAPVLGGTVVGSVTEDGSLAAGNSLTITDIDSSDNPVNFTDVAGTVGDKGYGTFSIIGNTWSYNLNNTHAAVQALDTSESLTDTFTFTASDGSSQLVTITINGSEDVSVLGGTAVGNVSEDVSLQASDSITITDVDNSDNPVTFTDVAVTAGDNGYGTFSITGNTWSYNLNNSNAAVQALGSGENLTDTFTFTASDGSTQLVSITINGYEDVPVLGGTAAGSVVEDGTLVTSNSLTITDVDSTDNPVSFVDVASTPGDSGYGTFALTENAWSYNLDNSHAAVQSLDTGESLIDTFTFTASDGSTQLVTITINGFEDSPVLDNSIADQTATEDDAFSFTFNENTFTDSDSTDTLIYTAILADGSALPTWLSFDEETRTFSGTPVNNNVGSYSLLISANDGSSTVTDGFVLTIENVNDVPTFEDTGFTLSEESAFGTMVGITSAMDVDINSTLTYSILNGDSNSVFAINSNTGAISVNDAALLNFETTPTYTLTVQVMDEGGLTATSTATIALTEVEGAMPYPVDQGEELATVEEILVEDDLILEPDVVTDEELVKEDHEEEETRNLDRQEVTVALTTEATDEEWSDTDQRESEETPTDLQTWDVITVQGEDEGLVVTLDFDGQNSQDNQRSTRFSSLGFVMPQTDVYELAWENVTFAEGIDLFAEETDLFGQSVAPIDTSFINTLDVLSEDLNTSYDDLLAQQKFHIKLIAGTSVPFSIGFAGYLLRGGTLLSSMFSSAQIVTTFDPIGILMPAKKKRRKGIESTSPTTGDQTSRQVEQIFENRSI